MKLHIKLNGRPLCGRKRLKRKLQFAETEGGATCKACLNAAAK